MSFAPAYLFGRLLFRIVDFFHHWYFDGSRLFAHAYRSTLERLDQIFALRMTLRHFFEPLYKDYTAIGRILGVLFRSLRAGVAIVFYAIISALFFTIYALWCVLPVLPVVYLDYANH